MLKHLFGALFYSEEDKIYNKMKKEIMSLPAHKFTTDTELVRVKDRDGFITFYAILIKDGYVSYKKDNKQHYEVVQVVVEDFSELKNEWLNFICDIFSEAFLSKEEK